MTRPTTSQARNRSQVSTARLAIRATQETAETIGRTGTEGVLNGRSILGFVRRSTITAMATTTNANRVPMLTISARVASGTKAPSTHTTAVVARVIRIGVWNFGWICPTDGGSRTSRNSANTI